MLLSLSMILAALPEMPAPAWQPPAPQTSTTPAPAVPEDHPWIIVADRDRWVALDPAGSPAKEWPRVATVATTADGRFEAAVGREPDTTALVVSDRSAPAAAPVVVVKNLEALADAAWLPDGSGVVFTAGGKSGRQVYVVRRADDGWSEPVRLSDDSGQCTVPDISSTGQVAYAVIRSTRGKQRFSDLIIHTGQAPRTVVKNSEILGFAWSPTGDRLAVSIPQSVHIVPLDFGEVRRISLPSLESRMQAHGAYHLAWRPDGKAIAADFRFLGGRSAPSGQPMPEFFGDKTIFILPLDESANGGKLVALPGPDRVQRVRWGMPPADAKPLTPRPDNTER